MIENILIGAALIFFVVPAFAYCFNWWNTAIETFVEGFKRGYNRERD